MNIKTFLRIWINPLNWWRGHRTNEALSKFINRALDEGVTPVIIDQYTCSIKDVQLWIENYPYAYGKVWNSCLPRHCTPWRISGMPDRATVVRLYDAINSIEYPDDNNPPRI